MSKLSEGSNYPNYGSTSQDYEVSFAGENRELRSLSDNITTNIFSINEFIKKFQSALNTLGSAGDGHGLRDEICVWLLSANQLVAATTENVAKLQTLRRGADKAQKLQIEKVTGHFQEVAKKCEEIQVAVGKKARSTMLKQDDQVALMEEGEERQQLQIQMQLELEAERAAEREEEVLKIERNIIDISQLMISIDKEILKQRAGVDSIESNIETAVGNVLSAGEELTTASRYLQRSRKRTMILILVLVVILLILIGVIVWSSR